MGLADAGGEAFALHQLHRVERLAPPLPGSEDGDDAVRLEGREPIPVVPQPRQERGGGGRRGGEDADGDAARRRALASPVEHAMRALTEDLLFKNFELGPVDKQRRLSHERIDLIGRMKVFS